MLCADFSSPSSTSADFTSAVMVLSSTIPPLCSELEPSVGLPPSVGRFIFSLCEPGCVVVSPEPFLDPLAPEPVVPLSPAAATWTEAIAFGSANTSAIAADTASDNCLTDFMSSPPVGCLTECDLQGCN